MQTVMTWILLPVGILLAGLILYWTLVTTEGSYLGARTVALLYNRSAERYDSIKEFEAEYEQFFLRDPMLGALLGQSSPIVLDVATGTGRVAMLLLDSRGFSGRVVGLDYARKMLALAAAKTADYSDRILYAWQNAMELPFGDGLFDLVSCIEALEFTPRPKQVLAEVIRVTQPGGAVFTSRRRGWEHKLMPGKGWSASEFRELLCSLGLRDVRIIPWQLDYDLVRGIKPEAPSFASSLGSRWKEDILRCPDCGGNSPLHTGDYGMLECRVCETCYPTGSDGVIELAGGQKCRKG